MKKRFTLLFASLAFWLGSSTVWGQQRVLLPQNQEESTPACSCGFDHGNDKQHVHQATPENWPHYPTKRSTLMNQVTPRRGEISNPGANFNNRDTIYGPGDVNLLFGAGESSLISSGKVNWPGTNGNLHQNSILLGSDYSKNAVMAIADFDGFATGALRDVRFYQQGHGNKAGTSEPDTVNKRLFTASVTSCGPTDNTYNSSTPGTAQGVSNQLAQYRATLSYEPAKDPLIQNFSGQPLGTVPSPAIHGTPAPIVDPWGGMYEVVNRINALGGQYPNTGWSNIGSNQYLIEAAGTAGAYYWPFKDPNQHIYYVPVYNAHKPGWADYDAFAFYGATADTLYTSTKDATAYDDGQPLLHAFPGAHTSTTQYQNVLDNAQYYRPTTILLSGPNTLDAITIGNIEWYAAYLEGTIWNTVDTLFHAINPGGCCHYSGWVSYYRDDVRFDMFEVKESNRFVDAAVRILDGADVCVRGNIKDNTATPHSINTATTGATDAILVLPGANDFKGDRSNFRLKIGGDADILHTQDSGYTIASDPLNYGYLYRDANFGTGPGDKFPTAQTDIYLSSGTETYTEVAGLNWTGYGGLTNNTGSDQTKWKPYASTNGSIYGVGGLYMGATDIYTQTIDGNDTTSIILIGSTTDNQDHFNIHSGGMLKNFRSACAGTCDSLVIGRDNVAPGFYLSNNTMPLYIINDGNGNATTCCDAGIRFHTPGVNNLNSAITSATGSGDLHIQAHSYIDIYDNINFAATLDNNVAFLSDQSYIKTQDFDYTAAGTDGNLGHLTLWAQGASKVVSPTNCGGYVALDNVTITSTQTANTWQTPHRYLDSLNLYNYDNLLNSGGCGINAALTAYNATVLDKGIQARIQSENDSVRINGTFDYTGQDGSLFVQGERNVEFADVNTIDFRTNTGTGDAVIQSKNHQVKFFNDFKFTGNEVTDLMVDGETGVSFLGGGTVDLTRHGAATAHVGIQSNTGNILFDGAPFLFDMKNTGNIEVWAGNDIRIEDALTYRDNLSSQDQMNVHFYANYDIWSNKECQNPGAPVNFVVTNQTAENTKTDWIAGRNIHTKDTVNFNYSSTGSDVRDLTLKALGGNIKMDRWTNISYDSDSTILLAAEMDCPTGRFNSASTTATDNQGYAPDGTGGNRNTLDGHIFLNDSFLITRSNPNAGETNLFAQHHIRTAMVTLEDLASTGNNTTIKSHMGDIFLGYSTEQDACQNPAQTTNVAYKENRFVYNIHNGNIAGKLSILAGYEDQSNTLRDGGGNIYFTHIDANMGAGGTHPIEISIPFSNEYYCGSDWTPGYLHERLTTGTMKNYEHAGIIGGVGRCGIEDTWADYTPSQGPGASNPTNATDTSLIYLANHGDLLLDAGTRGNIIMNRGSFLNFQNNNANGFFLTRYGDVDMRYATDVQKLEGSVLFLASSELANKLNVEACHCDEQRNNVYLQDFQFDINGGNGSVFVGADNNIKLQYGGLRNIGTQRDPFLSENVTYPCATGDYHCDSDTSKNKARELILDFNLAATSGNGGFAAVSSDLVDVYKNLVYNGGTSGQGMSSVPKYGSLHGENVAGYGLYIKTQANKKNWNKTDHGVNSDPNPLVGAACDDQECNGNAYLHQTARVTFHADARLYAENQKVLISSPVLATFGNADYNTHLKKGGKTSIMIQADSLIYHDSLIIDGPKTQFSTWSGLYRNMPVIRLGHQRFTPPIAEEGVGCKGCFTHPLDPYSNGNKALDTVFVTFRNDATVNRLHTLVAEHAVISFLTDSFDHQKGNPTLNAKFFTDTFKIRNHVELFNTPDRTHDGHFELVSETQMGTKDYAGIYSRHLHMEPIAPSCSRFGYSQLWMQDHALDVITSSTFGGFGWLHADVHVENDANLFPGYASLRHDGNCYEQQAGILKMQDLRLDNGANLTFSVGDNASTFVETYECDQTFETIELGRYVDCLDVDSLTIYGSVHLDLVVRPEGLILEEGESRCFPVIRYNSVQDGVINHLKMNRLKLTSKDHPSIEETYYLTLDVDTACNIVYICIATMPDPVILRPVNIPEVAGVTSNPVPGTHYVRSGSGFSFKLKFDSEPPLKVLTGRIVNGQPEELFGTKNANGEYEYVLYNIRGPIQLSVGPDYATDPNSNETIEGALVWAYNNTIYIKVDRADIASIYSVAGQLVKQIELPEGNTLVPMDHGVYIVTLKDGSVHKVIVR